MNHLYATDGYAVAQLDSITGATQTQFASNLFDCAIEISPDGKTLFVTDRGNNPRLSRYDISGATPVNLQQATGFAPYWGKLVVSHDGKYVATLPEQMTLSAMEVSSSPPLI